MIDFVHSNPRLEKRLNDLRKSEKFAKAAAKKVEKIIDNLIRLGESSVIEMGRLTRYGEARIPNCVKYDLGKGYRLVCVKQQDHLFLLFVGTHDDCNRWIEDNRGIIPNKDHNKLITRSVYKSHTRKTVTATPAEKELDYDDLLMARITEKDLRWVFRGLCGNKSLA